MRKLLLLVLMIVFMVPVASFSQFGILGGLNLAKFSGEDAVLEADETVEPDFYVRPAAGVFLIVRLLDGFALRPEALYTMKGAKYDGTYQGFEGTAWAKADYLEVPVLLQYTMIRNKTIAPFLLAGPYLALNLNAQNRVKSDDANVDETEDVEEGIKDLDYGILLGLGICILNRIEISARYSVGLTTVDDTPEIDMKNQVIELRAGIRLTK